uniref:probable G-protein coupled receptor 156 n=1 Tax=Euleptes europaea TaxID=460621 RepID=UPI002541D430|nr:probable G-protein coupled receptor 156 [Euleptes europaea]
MGLRGFLQRRLAGVGCLPPLGRRLLAGDYSQAPNWNSPAFAVSRVRGMEAQSSSDSSCKKSPVSSAALQGAVWVLLTGGILLSFFFLVFTIRFRKNRIVKMSSPNLNVVTLLGSGLTYGSAYLFGIEKQNPLSRPSAEMLVQMRICLLCVGGSLAFGPILGKSWRLYKVFTQRAPDKRVIIKDPQLLLMVGALVGADVALLSAWILLDPVQCLPSLNAELKVTEKGLACVVHRGYFCMSLYSELWLILFLGFKGILLMYGAYLAGLTYGVSCPPVNQSVTLLVGIAVIFLSAEITLAVNRFFHSWHNLVFGATSGGIFVCTTTITCMIFTPQVQQWKAFENQNENLGQVAKYFTSSSKNFHSTVYSEEEICQLLGEKHAMMQLLAEKETAIASLQEQVNSTKEKLTRLVAAEDNQEAADSPDLSAFPYPHDLSAASPSSRSPEDSPADLSLPGQERNSWQYYPMFSNSGSSNKNNHVGDLERTAQRNVPLDITDTCRLLNGARNISRRSHGPSDHDNWLFQYAAPLGVGTLREPLGENFSPPRGAAEQPQVRKPLPGVRYVSRDELQEVLQELSVDHKDGGRTSARGPEQSTAHERSAGGCPPQEMQANPLARLSPYETRLERKIPTCLPGSVVPGAWCVVSRTAGGRQRSLRKVSEFPWAVAGDTPERRPWRQPCSFPSPRFKSREENGWLLDKHPVGNSAPLLSPGGPRAFHRQPQDFARYTGHLYPDFDSSSTTTTSSGGRIHCHHRHGCEGCRHSLSSSSGSCSTDIDSEPGISGRQWANLFAKPQPVVNFNEDLEPTYV